MLEQVCQIQALPRKKTDHKLIGYLNQPQIMALLDGAMSTRFAGEIGERQPVAR